MFEIFFGFGYVVVVVVFGGLVEEVFVGGFWVGVFEFCECGFGFVVLVECGVG